MEFRCDFEIQVAWSDGEKTRGLKNFIFAKSYFYIKYRIFFLINPLQSKGLLMFLKS